MTFATCYREGGKRKRYYRNRRHAAVFQQTAQRQTPYRVEPFKATRPRPLRQYLRRIARLA